MADPERRMIAVAVAFAILEKFISMLGKLNFIWATTVLLGGFASDLLAKDFWFVSVILVAEGIRIFGRRGELHTGFSYLYSFIIQECSAVICFILSYMAPKPADYGPSDQAGNRNVALKLFYCVSMVESGMVLPGLVLRLFRVWSWGRKCGEGSRWVSEVKTKYKLDDSQIITPYRFFHHAYSRCVSGSIFDSSNITIVSYSVELLESSNGYEKLMGARLLSELLKQNPLALERLRSLWTIRGAVEMLIDMLTRDWSEILELGPLYWSEILELGPWYWSEILEQERIGIGGAAAEIITNLVQNREAAAEIISNLVQIRVAAAESIRYLVQIGRNRTLVMAAPNSMESIASLLYDGNQVEIISSQNRTQSSPEDLYSNFSKVGLCILKQLANDYDNRAKMGSNRGLLLKIIALTESNTPNLHLKILAIDTLTSIARDREFRESIGGTDGVLHNFFSLFFNIHNEDERELVSTAGEALGFLSLENHHNCEILMNLPYLIEALVSVLNNPVQGTYAARILRNLYAYLEAKSDNLNKIRAASAEVVRLVMEKKEAHQEAAIGLAAQIFKFPSQAEYELVFGEQEGAPSLISKLRDVLQQYASPSKELPNIRRFSILLLIAIMKMDVRLTIGDELRRNLMNALKEVKKTTSVLESYNTFSGTIGLTSHPMSMSITFLAHSAMDLLHPDPTRRQRE